MTNADGTCGGRLGGWSAGGECGVRAYCSHYSKQSFRASVTKYVYQCILYVYKAISGVQIIILYHTTPYVQLTVFELLSW